MNTIRLALAALALGALAATFAAPVRAATTTLSVTLNPQNSSGETGTATLTQEADGVQVVIALQNAPAGPQPAHIHPGACSDLNPAPLYPLTSVAGGNSTTLIKGATIDGLLKQQSAINVHKSTTDLATYVACGDISAPSM
ncbi:MAG: hypothetical protein ABI231_05195 [Candidatus Tumulicola sp.]